MTADLGLWSEQRARAVVYARSQGRCEVCGRQAHTVHHRVKRGQGGTWSPANLLHICGDGTRYCHGWIEQQPTHAMTLGLWVPTHADPRTTPAFIQPAMFTRDWWTHDDDGMLTLAHDHPTGPTVVAALAALAAARGIVL